MTDTSIQKVIAEFMCDRKTKKMHQFELEIAGNVLRKQGIYVPLHSYAWDDFRYDWKDVFACGDFGIFLLKDHDYLLREIIKGAPIGVKFDSPKWNRRLAYEFGRRKKWAPKDCGASEMIRVLESGLSDAERELERLQGVAAKYRADIAAVNAATAQVAQR